MESERVGIREFRENLARYIESAIPVAITRHGETVGFTFLPGATEARPIWMPYAPLANNWMP